MTGFFQDFRYALRQLRKSPGFAGTVIVILALGIGGTTAIFSTINPILFEPLPYPNASRIMMIWYAGDDGSRVPQAFHTYREVEERSRSFDAIAVMKPWQPTLTGPDQPERVDGQQVSAGYLP
jgi:putative ABC transport system permease protein